jgi:antitoxin ParD1/3/4
MHVSLPNELENMVKDRVNSGVYGSASEVVREALRKFFHVSEDDTISPENREHIQKTVAPRLETLENGTAVLHDFDEACDEINKNISK